MLPFADLFIALPAQLALALQFNATIANISKLISLEALQFVFIQAQNQFKVQYPLFPTVK